MLPYRRVSGNCQLLVRLHTSAPLQTVETATVDQIVGAAMRVIEVCILKGRPGVEQPGGVAVAGLSGQLDVVIWGAAESEGGVGGGGVGNGTVALNGSGGVNDLVSGS